jgi:hypothetical protein
LYGTVAYAQSNDNQASTGSVYSKIGIGYPVDLENTASRSMGLLGVSYNETLVGSIANPAQWGNTVYGLGVGDVGVQSYQASSSSNRVTNSNFSVHQFQLQLPIIRGKLGISGSFSPVTQSEFRTFEEKTRIVDNGTLQDTLNYGIENRGSGGTNRAELGFGWQINKHISVGYAASILFMSNDNSYSAAFASGPYRPVNFTVQTSGTAMGNRFGTYVRLPDFLHKNDQLGLGVSVELPVTIDAHRKETGIASIQQGVSLNNEQELGDGTIKLPAKISAGISYYPSQYLMVATEGLYQGWSHYKNDFKPSESEYFDDRYKLGLGMQYFPYVSGSDKFLSKFKYRVGASYDTGHLRLEGQQINTLMFSLGLGIRSPNSSSSIDLSFEYGIRGTKANDLIKEQIWGVRLSLNLAEVMFYRPKLQ